MLFSQLGHAVKNNPRKFWSFVKTKTRKSRIPLHVKWTRKVSENLQDKANFFNEYFHSVFIKHDLSHAGFMPSKISNRYCLDNTTISNNEILALLAHLDVTKSPAYDNITALFLKEYKHEILSSNCSLFNYALKPRGIPYILEGSKMSLQYTRKVIYMMYKTIDLFHFYHA